MAEKSQMGAAVSPSSNFVETGEKKTKQPVLHGAEMLAHNLCPLWLKFLLQLPLQHLF